MKQLATDTKFAHLGKPGTIFSKGFQRRLDILKTLVDFEDKKILDLGCGEGVWLSKFSELTNPSNVYGTDIDLESINKARENNKEIPKENIITIEAEKLNFPDNLFDIVFQNEVLEHVKDDSQTLKECIRVLKPQGKLIIFTPNRGWPFETHGIFFRNRYYWGNIPLLPWLPKSIYKRFAPHVRNYGNKEIEKLIKQSLPNAKIIYHKHVFPGFDGLKRKFGIVGSLVQKFFFFLEKTPFNFFGISHLIIVEKE